MPDSPTLSAFWVANPVYLSIVLGLLGLTVGSFLNVVILRLPQIMQREWARDCRELLELDAARAEDAKPFSLSFPGSHCPHCNTPIKPWQNIPVISYLLLRGRCASCQTPISWRYPLVELATAVASITVGFTIGWGPELLAYLLLTWALIALTGIDIDTQLLPDDITLPLLWGGLLFNLFFGPVPIADAVLGAAAGYLLLWSIYWLFKLATGKEGMGFGDFKLLAALGAWLGWQSIPLIILLSSVVGAVVGVLILSLRGQGRSQPLPFGPYLAAAGWITLLWGESISALIFGGSL
jgi:leader peptidase (prepilin peptidase)/N-methyltransferase